MKKRSLLLAGVLFSMFGLVLTGCGGDGSGSTPTASTNVAPAAHAGTDQSVLANAVVTLDGSKSTDADNDPLTYAWTLTTKPAASAASLVNPTSAKPSFTADSAGAYVASLTVNDGMISSAADTVNIAVSVDNAAPVASAGVAQNVVTGSVVNLDGSASSDANGDPLTYVWTLTAKPTGSAAALSSPTSVRPAFMADLTGSYTASLVVNDGRLSSSNAASVSIMAAAANVTPVANAGVAQSVVTGTVVTLDGSASSDANGDALSYAWTLTARPAGSTAALSSPTSVRPTFAADLDGTYVASLTVNDGKANSAVATVGITAVAANVAPVANAGASQNVMAGAIVTLDGSASSDANHDSLTYAWTLTSKPAGSKAALSSTTLTKPTFTADLAGTYVATLLVNDGKINSVNASSVSIIATPVNVVGPGQFMEAVLLKTITTIEITSAMALAGDSAFLATPRYAVQAYRLTYLTLDGRGQEILASALVALPQKPANTLSPVLSYQHGSITLQANAPSNLADLGGPPVVLASLGYIVLAADYVGYGASKGAAHPYLLSAPSASAVIDLLTAAKYWRQTQHLPDNRQLFLTGYSEGGYVTMATHRALQAGTSMHRNELVRVLAGAGPYNVGLTLDELLKTVRKNYFPLGELLVPGFLKYLSDAARHNVRDLLLKQLLGSDADVTFMPTVIDNYMADDRSAIEILSNVFDWGPEVPLNLFHGRDDLTVSYLNASGTLQVMQTRGAGNVVTLTDCTTQPAGHAQCVLPYWRFVLDQFAKVAKDL